MNLFQQVDDRSIDTVIEETEELIALEFTAAWCGPCRVLAPILERLAAEYEGRLRVLSLDADENPHTVTRFSVRGMPTIVFLREGLDVDRSIGAVPEKILRSRIDANLGGVATE
ncbi:MAG: thiol reductase thioredoxin [Gemmatimonas sp.]|nr:thiol reductase thioredoxin [Gemmatimonas sp.]